MSSGLKFREGLFETGPDVPVNFRMFYGPAHQYFEVVSTDDAHDFLYLISLKGLPYFVIDKKELRVRMVDDIMQVIGPEVRKDGDYNCTVCHYGTGKWHTSLQSSCLPLQSYHPP